MSSQAVSRHRPIRTNHNSSRSLDASEPTTGTSASPEQLKIHKLNAYPCITIRRTGKSCKVAPALLISEFTGFDLEKGVRAC